MVKGPNVPEPGNGISYADTHCHLPWTEGRRNRLPSNEAQLRKFKEFGGEFIITCSIDLKSTKICMDFAKKHTNVYFSCGMAPQTVTYTQPSQYKSELKQWKDIVEKNLDHIIVFGELGLDFHHAKTLKKREQQILELENILSYIKDKGKPTVLHVRNAGPRDIDNDNKNHEYNDQDAATRKIVELLEKHKFDLNQVLFHCFSGPPEMNQELVKKGFRFSVPSSAFGQKRWYKMSKSIPLDRLVTETDSPFQHPYLFKPTNTPSNARYAVAAIAHSHNKTQEEVGKITVLNAKKFFQI